MKRVSLFLLSTFLVLNCLAQSKYSFRDIKAGGYLQVENFNGFDVDEWLDLGKANEIPLQNFDPSLSRSAIGSSSSNGAVSLAFSLLNTKHLDSEKKLVPYWRFGVMQLRETDYDYFWDRNDLFINNETYRSLDFAYSRNMLRLEFERLWRTDDRKKAFVDFGIGYQFGLAYSSELNVNEFGRELNNGVYEGYSSVRTYEAKNAITNYVFLPVNINIKIVENLFVELNLRSGLKHLSISGGPSSLSSVYGLGIGARYILL